MTSHLEVARAFGDGKTKLKGSRMFIEGDTVYSYGRHFPIAKRYFKDGIDYIFNTKGYSSSTATHKSYVFRNLSGTVLQVRDCDLDRAGEQYDYNKKDINELKGKEKRARLKHMRDYHRDRINELEEQNMLLSNLAVKQRLMKAIENDNNKWN